MDISQVLPVDEISNAIDEGLYSRQLYVLGHAAMEKMQKSDVLIIGLGGLGVEIAKNVALAGVKSVTLFDPTPISVTDLGTQFFARKEDIGQRRDQVTQPRLAELNSYVPIRTLGSQTEWKPEIAQGFQCVVLTGGSIEQQLALNDFTHTHSIQFIAAETRGLFGSIFCDFGADFTIVDPTGEQPLSGMVTSVDKDLDALVTTMDEVRHGLEDGDYVTFSEIKGLDGINESEPRKITVKGPYSFTIGDTTSYDGLYTSGGLFTQVKMPKVLQFKTLRESLESPEYLLSDFAKFDRPATLHAGFQALSVFRAEFNRLPAPRNEEDAAQLVAMSRAFIKDGDDLNEDVIKELAFQSTGELCPMMAVIGGFVAQEVLKACSSKFTPLFQHLYFDSLESLPDILPNAEDCAPTGSRYDGQVAVFGNLFVEKLHNARQFLVGSGAIGCEMLKNWAMMGLGTGPQGHITVTDLDTIEKSNLNRQFLFRPRNVGQFKAEVAAAAVSEMNPEMEGKILSRQDKVGDDTEDIYGDEFFAKIDGVTNALDNIAARTYMDRRCVLYEKPLLESGTLGTKANVQVIYPYLTESYSTSQDPPEKEFPVCTIKSFPNSIEHTIPWARSKFDALFVDPPTKVNLYLSEPNYIGTTMKAAGNEATQLSELQDYLVTSKPTSFADCVTWARKKFEVSYNNDIRQLLHSLPADSLTSSGTPFWSGPKRAPIPLHFDENNETHMLFVISASNLHAYNYGIPQERDPGMIKKFLSKVQIEPFEPKSGVKVQLTDAEPVPADELEDEAMDFKKMLDALPAPSNFAGFSLHPVDFEKDDDSNFHIDFITSCSNLRANNYGITIADKLKTKFIAGKIIPAIATTTALATGLVCLELYKVVDKKMDIEKYKNGFVNLALPFFAFSEPVAAKVSKYADVDWTLWDRIEIKNNPTLGQVVSHFKDNLGLEVTMLSHGVSMLFSFFMNKAKMQERLKMTIPEIVKSISKKEIPSGTRRLLVEVMVNDSEGEDVEVPFVLINIEPQ